MCLLNSYTLVAPSLASGEARRGSIPPSRAVTEEQGSQKPNSAQPEGRHVFWAHTSLFTPYRSLQICSSFTPRLSPKSIAANVQLFRRHITRTRPGSSVIVQNTSQPMASELFIGAPVRIRWRKRMYGAWTFLTEILMGLESASLQP